MEKLRRELIHILKTPADIIEKQKMIEILKQAEILDQYHDAYIDSLEIYPLLTPYINDIAAWTDLDPVIVVKKIKLKDFDINEKENYSTEFINQIIIGKES